MKEMPREVNLRLVVDHSGVTHQVLEQCDKKHGVRYVMAQDSEAAKERDKYKLRAHLQADRIAELEALLEVQPDAFQVSQAKCWQDALNGKKEVLETLAGMHGMVMVPREMVLFLLGEGSWDGDHFGDTRPVCNGEYQARYWWRIDLRARLAASEGEG